MFCVASVGTSISDGANGRRMNCEIERINLELCVYNLRLKPPKWQCQDAFFKVCENLWILTLLVLVTDVLPSDVS